MEKTKWLVAAAVLLFAAAARAGDNTAVYVAPYAGYTHLRIDHGQLPDEFDTLRVDAFQLGLTVGIRIPAGLMIEGGRSRAIHTDFFLSDDADIGLKSYYGAIGWRIPFGDGWHFTPKAGRGKWRLSASDFEFFDFDNDPRQEISGWDNFWELNLSREIDDDISLGLDFRDVDAAFGHSRSVNFVATFAF